MLLGSRFKVEVELTRVRCNEDDARFLVIATPLAALLPRTASLFRPEPPSWLRPRCSRPTRRQHFNTRTTTLAVRCPDREQGCGDVPTACDSLRFNSLLSQMWSSAF